MSTALRPNTDLVAVAFLKTVLARASGVGVELPGDDSWTADGFVQVTSGIGGSSGANVPLISPVVSVKCWARNAGTSRRPPRNKASNLAEAIRAGCNPWLRHPVAVTLPGGYPGATVHAAYLLTEPRPLPGDDSAFACSQFDLRLSWTRGMTA